MRKAVCQGQKEEGNHPVCRAKPEDWGNLFLFIYPWANQDKPLWGVPGDKHGASRKAQALKSKKRQLFTASSMPEKSNKNKRIKYKSPAGLLHRQITITDTSPKNGSVSPRWINKQIRCNVSMFQGLSSYMPKICGACWFPKCGG